LNTYIYVKIVHFSDFAQVPIPENNELNAWIIPAEEERTSMKALHIVQPDGPSFKVTDGNLVEWEGFRFRVGFTSKEGIVLHTVTYMDRLSSPLRSADGEVAGGIRKRIVNEDYITRPIAYRLSVAEMVVPYGDPAHPHYQKVLACIFVSGNILFASN
jgi:primary-amine oxidase